eukprot:gb/GECH01001734.1/.p1 GENE.gb/GECH01001734.1/~~gb/GECH01001734.1/.p1  ORF type:complete len:143 (+),score=20.92 gb/GECH01001734.1/:1-429(+)
MDGNIGHEHHRYESVALVYSRILLQRHVIPVLPLHLNHQHVPRRGAFRSLGEMVHQRGVHVLVPVLLSSRDMVPAACRVSSHAAEPLRRRSGYQPHPRRVENASHPDPVIMAFAAIHLCAVPLVGHAPAASSVVGGPDPVHR